MNPQPNRFFHLSLIFLVALNLVPHFNDYTVPTLAVGGVCLVWRLLYEFQITALPNFWTKLGLVAALTYLVFINYGQILGLQAGSALLICAVSLKLIDRVRYRDAMVLLFLNFMLLLARFFESQTLGITIFAAFDIVITTALLVQLHNGSRVKFDIKTLLKTGGRLFVQITPFMVLLFFVFPRYSATVLQARSTRPSLNGFNESLDPGSIERLAQLDQAAFRVRFISDVPNMTDLYWRGGVLKVSQGMKWQRGEVETKSLVAPPRTQEKLFHYEILQESGYNDWVFALDRPFWIEQQNRSLQKQMLQLSTDVFRLKKPVHKKIVYEGYSKFNDQSTLSSKERLSYLQVTPSSDPRVQELVTRTMQEAQGPEDMAYRLMGFYQKQFRYTLNPGQMKGHDIGEFLFDKKVGFCEHFAVSFADLMRLMGVPSRVVIGFHGGQKNDLSDYYLVTTKDAHAWTEIWSDEKKSWLRFDPTVMVAPLRFEIGGDLYHSMSEEERRRYQQGENVLAELDWPWFKKGKLALDAMATRWNLFLLQYDQAGQQSFFARLGFQSVNQNLLLTLSLLILLSFFLWIRRRNRLNTQATSAAQRAYLELREKFKKKGFEKESYEGPRDFLLRAQGHWPQAKPAIEQFTQRYLLAEYGMHKSKVDWKKQIKQIEI